MARVVVWNKRAQRNLDDIINYYEENVSAVTARNFVKHLFAQIEKINRFPEIGRQSKKIKSVRQYRVDKYRKIYYRVQSDRLIILLLFDDRRNPKAIHSIDRLY